MQAAIVFLVVLVAAGYAAWYWMPARWRRWLAARVGRRAPRLAQTLSQAPGCGACDSCDSCGTAAAPAADAARASDEKIVSLQQIRRR